MYGLYGLKHHIVEISGDVTDAGRTNKQTTSEYRATQLLICEKLSLAILTVTRSVPVLRMERRRQIQKHTNTKTNTKSNTKSNTMLDVGR